MILINNLTNGHELYINGVFIGKTIVGSVHYFNEWNLKHSYFIPDNIIHFDQENIIAIRSFASYEYGIGSSLVIGDYEDILNNINYTTTYTVHIYFAFSILLFCFGIYFLIIHNKSKSQKSNFYFSMICLCSAIYYTNFTVYKLPISYLSYQKIIISSLHGILIFTIPFLKTFLNLKLTKLDKYLCLIFTTASIIGTLLSKDLIEFYTFRNSYLTICIFLIIYFLIITFKAILSKNKTAIKLGLAVIITSLFVIYDAFVEITGTQSVLGFQINGFGLVLFLILIALDIVNQYSILYKNASTDGLTGLYNHIFFKNTFNDLIKLKKHRTFSLILLDIDNFKKFNDTYGHTTGDFVLKAVSKNIKDFCIKNFIAARYGGEEFVVLLNGTLEEESIKLAEQLRVEIESKTYSFSNKTFSITVSVGIATSNMNNENFSIEGFINEADKALYNSKRTGKNKITHYSWIENN